MSFMDYLTQKSRRRKRTRTRTAEAWLQNFLWRNIYQTRCKLKYSTMR